MSIFVPSLFSQAAVQGSDNPVVRGHVFAWPFMDSSQMQPRGGTTRGDDVVLENKPSAYWKALQQSGLSDVERDRRAILAMTGSYRVSFDFVETLGFLPGYIPPKPYFSWGTEHIRIIENKENFISLQHTLVMYFKDEEGNKSEPFVTKHWRQDWTYEDTDLHTFRGRQLWSRLRVKPQEVKGAWTQAVFQVDDSPRYEVIGRWSHKGGRSTWKSESGWRPLPRREFSVRDDYNILQGTHEITIIPNGWVHQQNNYKLNLSARGEKGYIAHELGINRYEAISSPNLNAAQEKWEKTTAYWSEVRNMWRDVFAEREAFVIKKEVDGKKLWQAHFEDADKIEKSGDISNIGQIARNTILKFISEPGDATGEATK